jgi:hypothetical protein
MPVVWNNVLGKETPWRARYRVIVSMIYATSWDGKQRQCFFGSYLDWLSEPQAKHFLSHSLVERVPEAEQASIDPAKPVLTGDDARHAIPAADAPVGPVDEIEADDQTVAAVPDSGAVESCIEELKRLRVPATAGAPAARAALRGSGLRVGNSVVAQAVKKRKQLSDAAPVADDDEVFEVVVI